MSRLAIGNAALISLSAALAVGLSALLESLCLPWPRTAALAFMAAVGWIAAGAAEQIGRKLDESEID